MNSSFSVIRKSYAWLFLAFVAILPVSETIALRNLLLFLCVVSLLAALGWHRDQLAVPVKAALALVPGAWYVWFVFLMVFPLYAHESGVAWANLTGQWGESLLAWIVGFGVVALLGRRGPSLLVLAWACAFPLVLHMLLVMVAWVGGFGDAWTLFGDPPLPDMIAALRKALSPGGWVGLQPFPWGFRGVEPMHGNLGYTACVAIALFTAHGYQLVTQKAFRGLGLVALGLFISFLSVVVANSRGAQMFGVLVLFAALALIAWVVRRDRVRARGQGGAGRGMKPMHIAAAAGALAVVVLLLAGAATKSFESDPRWGWMFDRVRVGFMPEDPAEVLCNGVSPELKERIQERFASRGAEYVRQMVYGLEIQDGGRIMLMRAGAHMMFEHPWGFDGSRTSYQKLMVERCGHPPVLHFSHAHEGWIDTALALGLPGIAILLALFVQLVRIGVANLDHPQARPWAMSLMLVASFWALRGFADSVYREHFIEMQAAVMAYIVLRARFEAASDAGASASPVQPENSAA